jgi:hypothetical protein
LAYSFGNEKHDAIAYTATGYGLQKETAKFESLQFQKLSKVGAWDYFLREKRHGRGADHSLTKNAHPDIYSPKYLRGVVLS